MVGRVISRDLKLAVIHLYENGALDLDTILTCAGFSERTFWRIKRLWEDSGDVVTHRSTTRGRPRMLIRSDLDYILELVKNRPSWFLDELTDLLQTHRLISVHFTTIHRELCRAGVSVKKLRRIAKERNDNL
ncbi:hypothetical protein BV25DRAFT_1763249, partial [Artomyces pyxidatus]